MKLILNSLWGKFCQRDSTTTTLFIKDAEELWTTLSDKQYESVYMNKLDSGTMRLTCKTKPSYVNPNKFTSLAIACHVTCFARLELLNKLRQLPDDSILYFDTDSIIYYSENGKKLIEEGSKLGKMVSELQENEHITSFCSTGLKSNTYTTNLQNEITYVKGFQIKKKTNRSNFCQHVIPNTHKQKTKLKTNHQK